GYGELLHTRDVGQGGFRCGGIRVGCGKRNNRSNPMDRRVFLGGLAASAALAASPSRDLIKDENARPGTTDWQLAYVRTDPKSESGWGKWAVRSPLIEGYAGATSVRPGGKIDLFVSTAKKAKAFVDVYRLGYYGGKGGRHMARLG